jgi:hypothetical protein
MLGASEDYLRPVIANVVRTGLTRDGCDRLRHYPGSRRLAAPSYPGQNTLKHNVCNVSVQ